jgi:hypothetical protein
MMEELLFQAQNQQTLPPLVLEAARYGGNNGSTISETTMVRNATISMNDVEGGGKPLESAGTYRAVTLGEEYSISPQKQQDITEDEIISIEETYRETAAAAGLLGSGSQYDPSNEQE